MDFTKDMHSDSGKRDVDIQNEILFWLTRDVLEANKRFDDIGPESTHQESISAIIAFGRALLAYRMFTRTPFPKMHLAGDQTQRTILPTDAP